MGKKSWDVPSKKFVIPFAKKIPANYFAYNACIKAVLWEELKGALVLWTCEIQGAQHYDFYEKKTKIF